MIISRLAGGLGNQLFQYAAGFALSKRLGTTHKIDKTRFREYKLHHYALNRLHITSPHASKRDLQRAILIFERNRGSRRSAPLESLTDPTKIYRLHGYWVNEKYFRSVRDELLKQFRPKAALTENTKRLLSDITTSNSVSIHVRRKDFLEIKNVQGICTREYYQQAAERFPDSTFFVFSDDIEWTKENIVLPYQTRYVDHTNAALNYEDLYLMSQCKHNIIANSTFSWWGAWLNTNPSKLVVFPDRWGNKGPSIDTVIPQSWRKANDQSC